jgi:glucan phosphorylase
VSTIPEGDEPKVEKPKGVYRVPPINLDRNKDEELIKMLDDLVDSSFFKSHSDLIRHIVRAVVPRIHKHPILSNDSFLDYLTSNNQPTRQVNITTDSSEHGPGNWDWD